MCAAAADEAAAGRGSAISHAAVIHARTTGQLSLAVRPRHQHNGDTRDPAKGPIARFGPGAKAPCSRPTVSAHERTTRQSCEEFTWCPASPPDSP